MLPPAIKFVLLFLGSYLLMQLAYTGYLWMYDPMVDPLTLYTAKLLQVLFSNSSLVDVPGASKVQFLLDGKAMVNIKEGCNGLSVGIALLAFLIAFTAKAKKYLVFVPVCLLILFVSNIIRLYVLVRIRQSYPEHFVLFHEYVFPIILYAVAFVMMVLWVRKNTLLKNEI
ncbi:MAG: exosortase family protein XrtF [Bacteroidetes bacterium B1(2017)]|nr:MAG: exosortase family protein XrtF [Bacteroidetes bacterium B1(2017)]